MKKIAIFVEGMTEQKFVVRLLTDWFNSFGVEIQLAKQLSGTISMQTVISPQSSLKAYVLVVDCSGEEQVMTQMRDQYNGLLNAGYSAIYGLRDIYPKTHEEIPLLRAGLQRSLPVGALSAEIHLAEMEVEAWFIAETTHFTRIHPKLTVHRIKCGGYDLNKPCESWSNPAKTLHEIYKLEKLAYKKKGKHVARTVAALSMEEIAVGVIPNVQSLRDFVDSIGMAIS